jgi:lipoprotein-releasing system permease protein
MVPRWRFFSIWLGWRWVKNIQRQKKANFLAISVIGVGIMTIIIGLSTGGGLQFEIEKKIERFHGSYQIRPYQTKLEGDLYAFSKSQLYIDSNEFFERTRSIESYHFVAWKSGIITFSDQMEGARLFGFDKIPESISSVNHEGIIPNWSNNPNSIWISEEMARKLGASLNDQIQMYFSREGRQNPSIRYFDIVGIFKSGITEWEDPLIICSLKTIQKLNKWDFDNSQAILLYTKNKISREQAEQLNSFLPVDFEIFTSQDDFPQLYQWINLFDNNTYLLGLILTIVASFNSVVVIFIRIIEKKTSLAILRAIGMRKTSLYKSFMTLFSPSILLGLVLGNILGYLFLFIQSKWGLIPLDPDTYYISVVPVSWPWIKFINANILIFIVLTVTTWITSMILSKINPSRILQSQ